MDSHEDKTSGNRFQLFVKLRRLSCPDMEFDHVLLVPLVISIKKA